MNKFYNIDDEVEKTLNSLEGMNSAEPNPFFYTRLKARMEKELLQPKTVLGWIFKPVYAIAVLAIILIINTFTIITVNKQNKPNSNGERVYSLYDPNS